MSSLISRALAVAVLFFLAAVIVESAPLSRLSDVQSAPALRQTATLPVPDPLPRRRSIPAPPPAPLQAKPVAISAASTAPPQQTASLPSAPRPAPVQRVLGTGQWGLINRDRAAAGLAPLQWSPCLASIAAANAARMAAQGSLSHANGVQLDLGCHLGGRAGENIGWLSSGINDAAINAMFMASPEHRANILGPYHFVGVAWAVGPTGAYIAVEFS